MLEKFGLDEAAASAGIKVKLLPTKLFDNICSLNFIELLFSVPLSASIWEALAEDSFLLSKYCLKEVILSGCF